MTSLRATSQGALSQRAAPLRRAFSQRAAAMRERLAHADPLIPVVGLTSLLVYVLHGFDGALRRDVGLYIYGAQRFLDGDPPYVGVLNRAGPLAHMLPAVGIGFGRMVGMNDLLGARIFFLL